MSRNSISKLRRCELQPLKLSESSKYCISQFQLRPAALKPNSPPPPSPADSRALAIFFLAWYQIPEGGDSSVVKSPGVGTKKEGKCVPRACQKLRNSPGSWQMHGPRAEQKLQMPHPRDWKGRQMPRSSRGVGGGGSWNWLMHNRSKSLKKV